MIYLLLIVIGFVILLLGTTFISYKLADVNNRKSIFYCYGKDDMKNDLICLFIIMPAGNILLVTLSKLLFDTE
jgi:hypothetical protein